MIRRAAVLLLVALPLLADRRANVENGLLRAVPIDGERLTLAERMQHYGVPGLSLAVWENGRIDWSGGYGTLAAATAERVARAFIAAPRKPERTASSTFGFSFLAVTSGDDGLVAIANHEEAAPLLDEIVRGVAAAYGWSAHVPAPRAPAQVNLESFTGRYAFDADDVVRFRMAGGRLVATRTGVAREARLDALGPNELVDRDTGTRYLFGKDSITVDGVAATRTRESTPTERIEWDAGMTIDYAKRLDPALVTEERLRARGLAYLKRSNYGAALAILKFNAERHPQSAAAHDALAAAQLAMNDPAGARASSQRVLELLPDDASVSASWRVVYRKRAEQRLATTPSSP